MVCDEAGAVAGRPRRAEGMSVGGGRAVSEERGGERRGVGRFDRTAPIDRRERKKRKEGRAGTNVVESVSLSRPAPPIGPDPPPFLLSFPACPVCSMVILIVLTFHTLF